MYLLIKKVIGKEMKNKTAKILAALLAMLFMLPATAFASSKEEEEGSVDVKGIIFHHLGDGYGWEVPFSHVYRIPLPVIVKAEDGKWMCFSSARLHKIEEVENVKTGKTKLESLAQIVNVEKDGKTYQFVLAHVSKHSNKVVQIFPLSEAELAEVRAKALAENPEMDEEDFQEAEVVVDGFVGFDGTYYREYKPHDISITKNVLALLIAAVILTALVMGVVSFYRRKGMKAPRKGLGFFEMLIDFIYTGVIKATLHDKAKKFAPFLLTCFFFILIMNLVGLIVIFPGGANLTGNIAVTLVLAVMVFVVTNIMGTKHYWKEIFWPDVPIFLKFPIPIMQFIEIFGIFTKPAALCVRLFANMMGGHLIVITLTLLIFIFAAFGAVATGGSVAISVIFSIFMLVLDVLVSFIQAYVFVLLATIFISLSTEEGHHEKHEEKESLQQTEENKEKQSDTGKVLVS